MANFIGATSFKNMSSQHAVSHFSSVIRLSVFVSTMSLRFGRKSVLDALCISMRARADVVDKVAAQTLGD